jgi:hypothetical protein
MHHVAANWSPIGQEQRHQLCYGVWGVVGSTGNWAQVVNFWEEDGFCGLAASFRHELSNARLQDPNLEKWWAAAELRSGGSTRILVPHPDTLTVEELCRDGVRGEVYAYELIQVAWQSAQLPGHGDGGRSQASRQRLHASRFPGRRDGISGHPRQGRVNTEGQLLDNCRQGSGRTRLFRADRLAVGSGS